MHTGAAVASEGYDPPRSPRSRRSPQSPRSPRSPRSPWSSQSSRKSKRKSRWVKRGEGHDRFTESVNVVEEQPQGDIECRDFEAPSSNEEDNPSLRDFFHPNQFALLRLVQNRNSESTSSTTEPSDGGDVSSSEHVVEEHHDNPFTNSDEDSSVDEDVVGATSNESDYEEVAVRGRRSSRSPRPRRRRSGSSRSPSRSHRPRRSRSP